MKTKVILLGIFIATVMSIFGCIKEIPVEQSPNDQREKLGRELEDVIQGDNTTSITPLSLENIKNYPDPQIEFQASDRNEIKDYVNLEKEMPPIHRTGQDTIGSCTAWAIGYSAASYYLNGDKSKWSNSNLVSPSYIFSLKKKKGANGYYAEMDDVLNLITLEGTVFLSDKPYSIAECLKNPTEKQLKKASHFKLNGWEPVFKRYNTGYQNQDYSEKIRYHLSKGHPVIIAVGVNSEKKSVTGDIYYAHRTNTIWRNNPWRKGIDGGHAMTIIGYDHDKKIYKLMNSWGGSKPLYATYSVIHNALWYAAVFTHPLPGEKSSDDDLDPVPASISINPKSIDFGKIPVSGNTSRVSIRIKNNANKDLDLRLDISRPFTLSSRQLNINANGIKTVEVIFSSLDPGIYEKELVISNLDKSINETIPIRGEVYKEIPVKKELVVTGNLDFSRVLVGTKSRRSFTISNPSSVPIEIYNISTPDGFNVIGEKSFTMDEKSQKTVQVEFNPERAIKYYGRITIGSELDNLETIDVSGEGYEHRSTDPDPPYEEFETYPRIGTFTNPIDKDIDARNRCKLFFHGKGNIIASVLSAENNTIAVRVKKRDGAFIGSGYVYVKLGEHPCSETILAERAYYTNDRYVDLSFNVRGMRRGESKTIIITLTATHRNEPERFYTETIRIVKR